MRVSFNACHAVKVTSQRLSAIELLGCIYRTGIMLSSVMRYGGPADSDNDARRS